MTYDLCYRYRRAMQPDGLRTVQTALRAANEAANDARLAGIDPETDPATLLLARHLGRIAAGADPEKSYEEDTPLRRKCIAKIDELKSRPAFIALARRGVSYDPEAKRAFHLDTKRALRAFAHYLGLTAHQYELRSNQAGPAVSGEITLHADTLYLQVSIGLMGPGREILFRRCNSRTDYCGHRNGFADIAALADHPKLANLIRRETGLTFQPRQASLV